MSVEGRALASDRTGRLSGALNEAIGREEREAMARELTAGTLHQEIERAERHMRVVADDHGAP